MDANFPKFIEATCQFEEALGGFLKAARAADLDNNDILRRLEDAIANVDSGLRVTITEDA